jgi:NTP pyrophosphatase (non-canonical NTP hydrolase)
MEQDLLEIINHYGVNNQLRKFNEECYELIEAIIDYKYVEVYKGSPAEKYQKGHLIEELSDVTVMLKQFQAYYGITDEEIEEVMRFKIERQKERMKNESN